MNNLKNFVQYNEEIGVSIPRQTTWEPNDKKRKFSVGNIVKRKGFDDKFRIEEILTWEDEPSYKLWNISKNRSYGWTKEKYLENFVQYNEGLFRKNKDEELGESIYNYILKNLMNIRTTGEYRFTITPEDQIHNDIDPLGEENWDDNRRPIKVRIWDVSELYIIDYITNDFYRLEVDDEKLDVSHELKRKIYKLLKNLDKEKIQLQRKEKMDRIKRSLL